MTSISREPNNGGRTNTTRQLWVEGVCENYEFKLKGLIPTKTYGKIFVKVLNATDLQASIPLLPFAIKDGQQKVKGPKLFADAAKHVKRCDNVRKQLVDDRTEALSECNLLYCTLQVDEHTSSSTDIYSSQCARTVNCPQWHEYFLLNWFNQSKELIIKVFERKKVRKHLLDKGIGYCVVPRHQIISSTVQSLQVPVIFDPSNPHENTCGKLLLEIVFLENAGNNEPKTIRQAVKKINRLKWMIPDLSFENVLMIRSHRWLTDRHLVLSSSPEVELPDGKKMITLTISKKEEHLDALPEPEEYPEGPRPPLNRQKKPKGRLKQRLKSFFQLCNCCHRGSSA